MNIQSIIILAVIILVCFLICRNLYKKSKNGEFSCGGNCSCCGKSVISKKAIVEIFNNGF